MSHENPDTTMTMLPPPILSKFMRPFVSLTFWKDLYREVDQDQVSNGAAALSYYFLLSIFPATIFMLTLLPYLPIENLSGQALDLLFQLLPVEAAQTLSKTVLEVTTTKKQGLLSFGAALTLWSASSGLHAIMQQLDITYDVRETRPFWKTRGLSILLTLVFGAFLLTSFLLIVAGGALQTWLQATYVLNPAIPVMFQILRWVVIFVLLISGFAILYYFGPNVKQKFEFVTPGSLIGVLGLIGTSLLFRVYVENFGDYSASYGSLGAVIVMMLWFYIAGHVILIGSEINALIENGPTKRESTAQNAAFAANKEALPEKPTLAERTRIRTPAGARL